MIWLRYAAGSTILTGLATAGYALLVEPFWIETTEIALPIRNLAPEFEGYRLVHISDIHADSFMTADELHGIVERVNALTPDMIAITGDYVTNSAFGVPAFLSDALKRLHASDGVFGIMGNHDYYGDRADSVNILDESNICDLNNTLYTLRRGAACLHLAGLDSVIYQNARLDLVRDQLPPDDAPVILLAHEPDVADFVAAHDRFAVQLSGHTHGGQIRFPMVGMVWWPFFGQHYEKGLYKVRDMWLYVNRGLGRVGLPIRFNCRPEITVITLHNADTFKATVNYQLPTH